VRNLVLACALVALSPGAASAVGPARGLAHQKSIYADATDAALRRPEGVACDPGGAVIVADSGNSRLVTYTWKDGTLDGGTPVRLAQLQYPTRVQIDSKGFVWVLERRSRRVVKVDAKGDFAGYLEPKGATTTPVSVAAFRLDPKDGAVLLDLAAGRVLLVAPDGKVERELPLPAGASGVADVAVDGAGRIYVLDAVAAALWAAEPGAKELKPLGKGLKDVMSFPTYLAPDGRGRLWVVDQNGNAVVRIGSDGGFQARELAMGWSDGALYYPGQLCLTAAGDLVVADRDNNRVQIFSQGR
jgi:sugar lactone lactonase YvrE